jgi:hypothetical protein
MFVTIRWENGGLAVPLSQLTPIKATAKPTKEKEWENFVLEKYGVPPSVTYFESPVVVDNMTNEIISDSCICS